MQISLQNVHKNYWGTRALQDVSLSFEPGELVALLGLNGAGKTTMLKAIAGTTPINHGQILWDAFPLRREDLDLRRRLLFVPDRPFLIPEETVLENIATYVRLYCREEDPELASVAADLVSEFDLTGKAYTPVGELSRGQSYKTGVAALCAVNPDLWLLDEPFASGMDAHGIGEFRRQTRKAVAIGRTVIYTTQLVDLAIGFSDRICVLHNGQVHAFVPPGDLKEMAGAGDKVLRKLLGTPD